jgi:MFS family permease
VSTAIGPLLGGYLITAVSWRAAFLINIPIGAVVLLLARHVPETRDPEAKGKLDISGATLIALALAGSTYALIEAPDRGMSTGVVIAAVGALIALAAFVETERKSANPMLPLDIFTRQFSAANLVTFVVYAALSGVFFLLVAFLQISMGYSAVAAGAASLPVTVLMLFLASRSGELAQRIGPRLPLAVGPLIIAAGLLLMTQIQPGDSYLTSVFPAVVVFGVGLVLVVSPVTATVLAAAPERRSGIASGVNNAVSRVASLLAVAVLPVIAGLTGHRFYVPHFMTHGFHVAMLACAGLAVVGGVLAWLTIDNDVLKADMAPEADGQPPARELVCAVAGPPLRPGREQTTDRAAPAARDSLAAR